MRERKKSIYSMYGVRLLVYEMMTEYITTAPKGTIDDPKL